MSIATFRWECQVLNSETIESKVILSAWYVVSSFEILWDVKAISPVSHELTSHSKSLKRASFRLATSICTANVKNLIQRVYNPYSCIMWLFQFCEPHLIHLIKFQIKHSKTTQLIWQKVVAVREKQADSAELLLLLLKPQSVIWFNIQGS